MELALKDISKTFCIKDGPVKALENINLDVEKGEMVCLLGPSGCGKTTVLNIIAGLEKPDSGGYAAVKDSRISLPGPDRVLIFQQDALLPWMNVINNVEFGLKNKKFPRDKIRPLAEEFLRMVNLFRFRDSYIHTLSGGMKQRVALARALVLNPTVLLMDEPFSSLDAQTRELLQDLLQKIWMITGKTVVFVTHNIREAVFLGDRVLVFTAAPGRIKKEFRIDLPRPRSINDLRLAGITNSIRQEIKDEIDLAMRSETDNE
ncbi:MAG: ABC transporter ATP-binding protein [Elusimicrobia bacterium]|nr:ABC transporter ATP-binding protein [Elusimicrobiota bacterium]